MLALNLMRELVEGTVHCVFNAVYLIFDLQAFAAIVACKGVVERLAGGFIGFVCRSFGVGTVCADVGQAPFDVLLRGIIALGYLGIGVAILAFQQRFGGIDARNQIIYLLLYGFDFFFGLLAFLGRFPSVAVHQRIGGFMGRVN